MDRFDDNAIRIADYLENKMTPEEEEAFMLALGQDAALRQQYEDQLLVEALLEENDAENKDQLRSPDQLLFQSADDHIGMVSKALEKKIPDSNTAPVRRLFTPLKIAAAILALLIAGFIIARLNRKKDNSPPIVKTPPPPPPIQSTPFKPSPPVPTPPTPAPTPGPLAQNTPVKVYGHYYAPYTTDTPPVEVEDYYKAYHRGNYRSVLEAKESDYITMGSGDKNDQLKQTMTLYKGLSQLALGKPGDAIPLFDILLQTTPAGSDLFYEAQWYQLLSWLKQGNTQKALLLAQQISRTISPHREKAAAIVKELNTP